MTLPENRLMDTENSERISLNLRCLCHDPTINDSVIKQFNEQSWNSLLSSVGKWLDLAGNRVEIAKNFVHAYGINVDIPIPDNAGFHLKCFQYFTDKTKQERGLKAKRKQDEASAAATSATVTPAVDEDTGQSVRKVRRVTRLSTTGLPSTSGRSHILPKVCIICRTTQYEKSYDRKRRPERLMLCELVDGGILTKAAEAKQDESLLMYIKEKDCVACEVRYHLSCHRAYTRCINRPAPVGEKDVMYAESFSHFAKYAIEGKIIKNKEIIRMTKLKKIFVKAVHDVEKKDATNYKTWYLKLRLQEQYPQLCFLKPKRTYESEFVYVDTLCAQDLVADANHSDSETTTDTNSDMTDTDDEQGGAPKRKVEEISSVRDRYATALDLRRVIQEIPPKALPWPPVASDLTVGAACKIIPAKLFNFVAWIIGASDDPDEESYVDVKEVEKRRILNITQDIVYLASKGKKSMPKHVALGMAVRHLSGSAQLIGLLNGFGYSVSHSFVLEHDTALALQEILRGSTALPSCLQIGLYTTLVWDNNDFGEETLSGKGSTHNTNGIAIQHDKLTQPTCMPSVNIPTATGKKSKQRTLPTPEKDIVLFGGLKKACPEAFAANVNLQPEEKTQALMQNKKKDAAYHITKFPRDRLLPSWTGFNQLLTLDIPPKATIAYLPVIDASPTELNTVNTILHRSIEVADALELPSVVVVVDQAIYAKAQIIRWQTPNFMKRIVIRLGAFHTIMTALACIGRRFGDAGLTDILIEAEVVASGSINGVINGHHYNRSIRGHKLLSEAFHRLRWQSFLDSVPEDEDKAVEYRQLMKNLHTSYPTEEFHTYMEGEALDEMLASYDKFIKDRCASNVTFAFWSSYLHMVEEVLLFIRASREGDWSSHLASVRALLPWMFAYDRTNYSRYLPVYWLEMEELERTHPFVHRELVKGNFAVQRQNAHGFAKVPCDMTIEQTANRDSKTRGGMKGFTTNNGAVNRWIRAHHERAAITRQCEEMAGKGQQSSIRADLKKSRMEHDQQAIDGITDTVVNMVNPFDNDPEADDGELIHLSSGAIASSDVCSDLINAHKKGEEKMIEFCQKRLQKTEVSLNDTLSKMKLKTFTSMGKTTGTTDKGLKYALRSDRELMARLVIMGKVRNIDLQKMLSHCLGPVPAPIAKNDGCLVKTNKSKLMHFLEAAPEVKPTVEVPKRGVWIVDGMALLQQLSAKQMPQSMGELARKILQQLVFLARNNESDTVHFVTDRYPDVSVKNAERKRRAACGSQRIKISRPMQPVPKQWKKFMSNSYNKEQIVEFLFERWQLSSVDDLKGVTIFLAHGESCHGITTRNGTIAVTEVGELHCSHEEADTRIFLHAKFIAKYKEGIDIIIKSPDTDVLVIGVALASQLGQSPLYFHTGKDDKLRTIHLQKIGEHLKEDVTRALIGLHCFSGCDSVSAFFGRGKTKVAKLLLQHDEFLPAFQALGESFTIRQDTVTLLDKFVCKLYGRSGCSDVNSARYQMFSEATRAENIMPPNKDALYKHIQRANYQAGIFKLSLEQHPAIPSPVGHGWKMVDSELAIDWMDMEPADKSVLELTVCSCKKSGCKAGEADDQCCMSLGIVCTELCTCKKCTNVEQHEPPPVSQAEDENAEEDGEDNFEGEENLFL